MRLKKVFFFFQGLPEGQGSREQGGKAINKEKNRYTNIIPCE